MPILNAEPMLSYFPNSSPNLLWIIAAQYQSENPNGPKLPWNWPDLVRQQDPLFLLQFPQFDVEIARYC